MDQVHHATQVHLEVKGVNHLLEQDLVHLTVTVPISQELKPLALVTDKGLLLHKSQTHKLVSKQDMTSLKDK